MIQVAPRTATYADIEALPPNVVGEILFGTLETHPRPAPRHGVAGHALGAELSGAFQRGRNGPGGWIFIFEPELHLGSHVIVPDIAAWRRTRLPRLPRTAWIETPPDWVCEVTSPATERRDRGAKRRIYADAGIEHYWIVNPTLRLLEAYALAGENWLLAASLRDDDEVRVPPFDALTFPLDILWPLDLPDDVSPSGA